MHTQEYWKDKGLEREDAILEAADDMTTEEAVRWLKGEIFGFNSQQLAYILTLARRLGYDEAVRYLTHGPEMAQFILNVANGSLRESIWDTAVELCEKLEGK